MNYVFFRGQPRTKSSIPFLTKCGHMMMGIMLQIYLFSCERRSARSAGLATNKGTKICNFTHHLYQQALPVIGSQ